MRVAMGHISNTYQTMIYELIELFSQKLLEMDKFQEVNLSGVELLIQLDYSRNEACCSQNSETKNRFKIVLTPASLKNLREVLAHELCHVFQLLSKALVLGDSSVLWDEQEYFLSEIKHRKRPWEKEAMMFAYNCKVHT